MRRKDLIIIGAVAFLAGAISFVISSMIFGSPKKQPIKVPIVQKISPEFPSPQTDTVYKAFFNDKAINPTQLIHIGEESNAQPFQETR